jgi:hypothetical protein
MKRAAAGAGRPRECSLGEAQLFENDPSVVSEAHHGNADPMDSRLLSESTDMTFSLDTVSAQTLKSEARALREQRAREGRLLTHGAALEEVARSHGYRDWNTASAELPDRFAVPFQVGMRVKGLYLEQPFRGVLLGVQLAVDMRHFTVVVQFDQPVNVTPDFMFAATRQRVTATVDMRGISPARRGNGQPQMRLLRE